MGGSVSHAIDIITDPISVIKDPIGSVKGYIEEDKKLLSDTAAVVRGVVGVVVDVVSGAINFVVDDIIMEAIDLMGEVGSKLTDAQLKLVRNSVAVFDERMASYVDDIRDFHNETYEDVDKFVDTVAPIIIKIYIASVLAGIIAEQLIAAEIALLGEGAVAAESATVAYTSASAEVGASIFGNASFITPDLATAIGKISVTSVMNGGDVEGAITNYIKNLGFDEFGDIMATGFDSETIGRLAKATAEAAVAKGDILKTFTVVGLSTLAAQQMYGSTQSDYTPDELSFSDYRGPAMFDWDDVDFGDVADDLADTGAVFDWDDVDFGDPGNYDWGELTDILETGAEVYDYGDGSSITVEPDGSTWLVDADGAVYTMNSSGDFVESVSDVFEDVEIPSIEDIDGYIADVTDVGLQALKLKSLWDALGSKPPRQAVTTKTRTGAQVIPTKSGTLVTKQPNGKSATSQMVAGQPYSFQDGTIVVNNGDGTYTVIAPDGTATTHSYGAAGGSGMLLTLGLGLAALTLGG